MIRNRWLAAVAVAALLPVTAAAQSMGGMPMPGMKIPAKPAAKAKTKPSAKPQLRKSPPHPTKKRGAKRSPVRATTRSTRVPSPMRGMDMNAPAAGSTPQSMPGMEMPSSGAPTPPIPSAMPDMAMPPTSAPAPAPQAMPGMDMPAPPAGPPEPGPKPGGRFGTAMPGMAMPGMQMPGASAPGADLPGEGSGTSRLPGAEGAMHGLHVMTGKWMLMIHGYAWGAYTDQSGPRGRDETFVTSMAMIEGRRDLGGGATLQLRSMLSLDALMGPKGYPSLFATGETANGVTPLVDRQHPHDLFMELSARVDVPLGGKLTGFVYGGPVAEPALGPSAFMHRRSAKYLPLAPITHHWFDSTHITFGVVTAGLLTNRWQFEGSAFRGREPDQHRWDIETPKLDSWSLRATWNPSPYWSAQVSYGRLKSPEALEPDVDEARTTASVQYARGGFSALAGFGMKNRLPGRALTAWLAEANWDLTDHHSLFGRLENVANDELFPDPIDPLHDRKFRVTRAELGYAYRVKLLGPLEAAIGGSGFVIAKPDALDAAYGKAPAGWTGFIKLSLGG